MTQPNEVDIGDALIDRWVNTPGERKAFYAGLRAGMGVACDALLEGVTQCTGELKTMVDKALERELR